jgi:hypothetical protein
MRLAKGLIEFLAIFQKVDTAKSARGTLKQHGSTRKSSTTFKIPRLLPGQRDLNYLTKLVVENSQNRGDNLTILQQKGLQEYAKVKLVSPGTSTEELVKTYEPIFDNLYFLGSLKSRSKITASSVLSQKTGSYGYARKDSMYPNRGKIAVNTLNDDGENRILKHVSTLLMR